MDEARAKVLLDESIELMIRANRLRERTVEALSADEVKLWNFRFGMVMGSITSALINGVAAEHPSLEPTEEDFETVRKTVRDRGSAVGE